MDLNKPGSHPQGVGVLPFPTDGVLTSFFVFSPPTRFGQVYLKSLKISENITVFLNSTLVDLEVTENDKQVERVRISTMDKRVFWVAARYFVLATGGIENARLLLAANGLRGLGNQHDLVGRYFMEHPEPPTGFIMPANSNDSRWATYVWDWPSEIEQRVPQAIIRLSDAVQKKEELLNGAIGIGLAHDSEGWQSLNLLYKDLKKGEMPDDFLQSLKTIIADFDEIIIDGLEHVTGDEDFLRLLSIYNYGEQAPNPDSRILLGQDRDYFGTPRPVLDWRLAEIDINSIQRTLKIVASKLGQLGLGRMKITFHDWPEKTFYYGHHMGTTRMHVDQKYGIVVAHCRVHGTENLYVAGSSVFPTSGCTSPTLTIIALAIRIAENIKNSLQ